MLPFAKSKLALKEAEGAVGALPVKHNAITLKVIDVTTTSIPNVRPGYDCPGKNSLRVP